MNWSALDWGILGPALIAGLLVLATHVPLGTQVLDRGIVFIDLAIAQIAGLGVIAADALGLPEGGVAVQVAAVCAALLGAWLLTWTERRAPQQQEALIGVMFILAACALGYGTCWMTGPLIAKQELESALSVRHPEELLAIIAVGKPDAAPPKPPRKPASEITTFR